VQINIFSTLWTLNPDNVVLLQKTLKEVDNNRETSCCWLDKTGLRN